jgi:response regulator RpfG family c-di-GMP phosphodiesterase
MKDRTPAEIYLPVLALAEPGTTPPVRRQAMMKGAKDLITKPPEPTELLAAVRNLLEIRFLTEMLGGGSERLDFLVDDVARQRTVALEQMQSELLEKFASTADYRDPARGGHAERVARISEGLAIQLGFPRGQATLMGRASLLHNVGKVAVSENIWSKPDKLTDE